MQVIAVLGRLTPFFGHQGSYRGNPTSPGSFTSATLMRGEGATLPLRADDVVLSKTFAPVFSTTDGVNRTSCACPGVVLLTPGLTSKTCSLTDA